ncbi:MAG: response regulator [Candidatus Woesearchaeota archaeon]|jgi:two-component system alkaline phosphatase synthesis response regulator PhoP|nr:response regulator [Candidatus Woesearchaeota archaeon]
MKKSVVIVEDDENIARAQELILSANFNVHIAKDGEEGLQAVKEKKPDLVVLDLMLPKMGGMEVCKSIRSDEEIKHTKIVMVTAKNQEKDESDGMDLGADDYIMKPFEADELLHVINQVLNK